MEILGFTRAMSFFVTGYFLSPVFRGIVKLYPFCSLLFWKIP